jgi:hypothetical protein
VAPWPRRRPSVWFLSAPRSRGHGPRLRRFQDDAPSPPPPRRFIDGAHDGTAGGNAVAILSRGGATVQAVPSGPTGGQTGGIMAVIDAMFEQDAFTGLTTENRAKRDRALAGV